MTLKWELGALIALLLATGVSMLLAKPINTAPPLERADNYSKLEHKPLAQNLIIPG